MSHNSRERKQFNSSALSDAIRSAEALHGPGTALCEAVRWSKMVEVERLLRGGVSPDVRVRQGMTPLMHASNIEIARLLVQRGADVNARDDNGRTPLIWFLLGIHRKQKAQSYINLLLELGADAFAVSHFGEIASDLAMSKYNITLSNRGIDIG